MLAQAVQPTGTATYSVIPHDFVIKAVEKELLNHGFEIEEEVYKANQDAQIASGILRLKQGEDQEMRMMFAWSNSYDKSMRFKCAIGGYLPQSGSTVVSGNIGTWGRKHTGTALQEAMDTVKHQLSSADMYYTELLNDKSCMKNIQVVERRRAEVLGILFFEHGLLTTEQLSIIKDQLRKPKFNYNADKESLWTLYCHIIFSLQKSHPRHWFDQQRLIHFFMSEIFDITNQIKTQPIAPTPVSNSEELHQITLDEMIEDVQKHG